MRFTVISINMKTLLSFIAVFSMVHKPVMSQDVMEDKCSETIRMTPSNEAGTVILTSNTKYKKSLRCNLFITAPPSRFVMISFSKVDLEPGPSPTTCQVLGDNVKIYNSFDFNDRLNKIGDQVCGEVMPESAFLSTNQNVTVRFFSDAIMEGTGFEFIYTAYHTAPCSESEFECENGACIDSQYKGDGFNNCGDSSDEKTGEIKGFGCQRQDN